MYGTTSDCSLSSPTAHFFLKVDSITIIVRYLLVYRLLNYLDQMHFTEFQIIIYNLKPYDDVGEVGETYPYFAYHV